MRYDTFVPPPSLQGFVRYFWVLESDCPYEHHSMACGCPELIFHYKGNFDEVEAGDKHSPSFRSGLHAQTEITRRFSTTTAFGIFGVFLYPFALPLLFGCSASELTNEMYDLHLLVGSDGRAIEEQVMLAADDRMRVDLVSSFLLARLKGASQGPPVFSVIRELLATGGTRKVEDLAAQAYLSTRQFERHFMQYAGLPPKLFAGIARFQQALEQYGRGRTLTSIAYDCGYYDQSHFIRDFRRFSGKHPREYFSGRTAATEWRDA